MNIKIDGVSCEAEYGEFILNIARRNNINIPTLCHSDALPGQGNCRLCVVDIIENGGHKIVASCVYPVTAGIEVITNSEKVINIRKVIIQLLLARVPNNEYINRLKAEYGVSAITRFTSDKAYDKAEVENEECVLCGLCVKACEALGISAIATINRGVTKKVSTPYEEPALECIGCGACARVCPTGAIKIYENKGQRIIWNRSFELLSCKRCGSYYITQDEMEYINFKLGLEINEKLCEKCKKLAVTEKLKDIYENVPLK
jgi:bidirectional [NiFe] hydrogenase diaphorase subunit